MCSETCTPSFDVILLILEGLGLYTISSLGGFASRRPHCTQSRCSTFISTLIDSFLCHCMCVVFFFLFIIPIFTSENNQSSFRTKAHSLSATCPCSTLRFCIGDRIALFFFFPPVICVLF